MSAAQDKIKTLDTTNLEIKRNTRDIHEYIYKYIDYISTKSIKRGIRENILMKSDVNRLSKLMPIDKFKDVNPSLISNDYPNFLDILLYDMGFITYKKDTEDSIYNSYGYENNYIKLKSSNYKEHIDLTLQEQEELVTNYLISNYSGKNNEFAKDSPVGHLTSFNDERYYYYDYDRFRKLNFKNAREFLLQFISKLKIDCWYSIESLIYYMEANYKNFLFPKDLRKDYKKIYEKNTRDSKNIELDGFIKVEGKYIKRFLEYIPFLMGYVDLAYRFKSSNQFTANYDQLLAFKPTTKLLHYFNKSIKEAKITVQPNFEISIESEIFPAQIMSTLYSIGKVIKNDVITQIKIEKNMMLQKVAKDSSFNPIEYLREISRAELPNNLQIELREWIKQSDSFVLYENMHLFESSSEFASVKNITVDSINKNFNIIKNSNELYHLIEEDEEMPVKKVTHRDDKFSELPPEYKTIFKKRNNTKTSIAKNLEKLQISKEIIIKLFFHSSNQLKIISGKLLDKGCVFSVNDNEKSITILQKDEALLKEVFKQISRQFQLDIKDK